VDGSVLQVSRGGAGRSASRAGADPAAELELGLSSSSRARAGAAGALGLSAGVAGAAASDVSGWSSSFADAARGGVGWRLARRAAGGRAGGRRGAARTGRPALGRVSALRSGAEGAVALCNGVLCTCIKIHAVYKLSVTLVSNMSH